MRPERYARYERAEIRDPLLSTIVRIARGLGPSTPELIRALDEGPSFTGGEPAP
jgi:hypothetical protein